MNSIIIIIIIIIIIWEIPTVMQKERLKMDTIVSLRYSGFRYVTQSLSAVCARQAGGIHVSVMQSGSWAQCQQYAGKAGTDRVPSKKNEPVRAK